MLVDIHSSLVHQHSYCMIYSKSKKKQNETGIITKIKCYLKLLKQKDFTIWVELFTTYMHHQIHSSKLIFNVATIKDTNIEISKYKYEYKFYYSKQGGVVYSISFIYMYSEMVLAVVI